MVVRVFFCFCSKQATRISQGDICEVDGVRPIKYNSLARKTQDFATRRRSPSIRLLRVCGPGLPMAMETRCRIDCSAMLIIQRAG